MYRHHPQIAAREAARRRRAHRPAPARPRRRSRSGSSDEGDVRLDPELAGGALMDVGCYCVSGSRLLAGEPERALGESVVGASGVDVAFPERSASRTTSSRSSTRRSSLPRRQELVAVGEEATLVVGAPWRADWGASVEIRPGRRRRARRRSRRPTRTGSSSRTSPMPSRDRAPPLLGREDALGQARAIDALYRSAETGASVEL